jgi:hypothetical protein
MGVIGDVAAYAQLQAADAVRDAARNPGAGGAGAAIGVGLGLAQQLSNTTTGALRPAGGVQPPPLPQAVAFFLAVDGKPQGPFDLAALAQRVRDGSLTPETLAWREGMPAWIAVAQIPEIAPLLAPR